MDRRLFLAVLALLGGAGRAFAGGSAPRAPSAEEHARTINALRPRRAGRPVVAVLGHHQGAEITDLMVPYGVLHRSGLAKVLVVGVRRGPFMLAPLKVRVRPHMDIGQFSARYPRGADYGWFRRSPAGTIRTSSSGFRRKPGWARSSSASAAVC